jgi:hypothetical protein
MEQIKTDKVELDVYSSTEIYGDHFKNANDKQFTFYMIKQNQ